MRMNSGTISLSKNGEETMKQIGLFKRLTCSCAKDILRCAQAGGYNFAPYNQF